MRTYTIRATEESDRPQWNELYTGYAKFYGVPQTPEMRDTVWSWLHDKHKETCGLVAEGSDGTLLGIAHYRPFARPLSATTGCFLDDLFVAPEARSSGVANALLDHLSAIASERGWSIVRWITADNNYRAQALYDRVATKTDWLTYDIKIG